MSVGIVVTKESIDSLSGALLREINRTIRRALDFREFLQGMGVTELTALGYTADEITKLKDAYNDVQLLYNIYSGGVTLPSPKDFRASAKALWGINVP